MKVILIEDVKKLGKKGMVLDLADGYARNCILTKKLGVEATKDNLAKLSNKLASEEHNEKLRIEEAKEIAKKLEGQNITLYIKAGENGRTFGSITSKEIAQELQNKFGYDIDKKKIILEDSLKNVGIYEIEVKIYKEVSTKIKVEVQVAQ